MGAYRLHGPETTPAALLAPHQQAILARAGAERCGLVIQDTTEEEEGTSGGWPLGEPELDFSRMKAMEGVGPLNDEGRKGFFLHTLDVVSERGTAFGGAREHRAGEEPGGLSADGDPQKEADRSQGELSLGGR
jgi:hypothetical protein